MFNYYRRNTLSFHFTNTFRLKNLTHGFNVVVSEIQGSHPDLQPAKLCTLNTNIPFQVWQQKTRKNFQVLRV